MGSPLSGALNSRDMKNWQLTTNNWQFLGNNTRDTYTLHDLSNGVNANDLK